ncbi:membrane protein [Lactiplantibacillus fabifermentans]|uniref:Integral membrane protein n=2 Tax=Lactiplantibacillus fabifermentans TaxID=483011 RepID=A0A0R2NP93_9LACO|nr:membrane protein [Lactiplantibacillus fabifermentans]ETY75271.1 membrane protein [Lactiplantibacillus fabifermentans T30PCM01]KRO27519.1 integral membrane protein [Lactiplantibacillus fabifermentans DSM 21115]
MQVLKVFELFLLQPLLWLGLLRSYLNAQRRVNYERHHFRSAIEPQLLEVRHFFSDGLGLGVIATIISLGLGIVVAPVWVVIYELLAIVSLIVIPFGLVPMTVFGVSWLIYWIYSPKLSGVSDVLQRHGVLTTSMSSGVLTTSMSSGILVNGLWLAALVLLATAAILWRHHRQVASPQIQPDQRGKRIVRYRWQQLLVVPVGVLVPGDWLHATLSWWPVFSVGNRSFGVLLLPLLVGASVRVYKQLPSLAWRRLAKNYAWLAAISVVFALIAFFTTWSPQWLVGLIVLVTVLTWLMLAQHRYRDQHQQFWFSDTDQGVRVIGLRPHTPADKLNLSIGDIILECNRIPVHTEAQFYAAILKSPTYVHLKVRNVQQELIITETAIYNGAPHELGIVLFSDQED